MQRDGLRRGVVTLRIGGDQGIALALKRLSRISAISRFPNDAMHLGLTLSV
jgi:hypothetical protein